MLLMIEAWSRPGPRGSVSIEQANLWDIMTVTNRRYAIEYTRLATAPSPLALYFFAKRAQSGLVQSTMLPFAKNYIDSLTPHTLLQVLQVASTGPHDRYRTSVSTLREPLASEGFGFR